METKEDLLIRLIEFGLSNPKGFNFNTIKNDKKINLTDTEKQIVEKYCENAFINSQKYIQGFPSLETIFLVLNLNPGV